MNQLEIYSLIGRLQNDETGGDAGAVQQESTLQIYDPRGIALFPGGPAKFHSIFPHDSREFPYFGALPYNTHFQVRLTTPPSAIYRPMISYLATRRERAQ